MAFFATLEAVPLARRQAFTPGNTGGGNPRPVDDNVDDPWTAPPIKPVCIPTKIAYPPGTGWIPVQGPDGTGKKSWWYRYPCRRTTARRHRILRQVANTSYRRDMPFAHLPVSQLERNPRPVHGRVRPDAGFKRLPSVRNKVDEDNS